MREEEKIFQVHVKPISPDEWEKYKEIRLEALRSDQHAFGRAHDEEMNLPDEEWQGRVNATTLENAPAIMFSARDVGEDFVGLVGAFRISDHDWEIASMYVKKEFRGKGVGKKLLEAILRAIHARQDIKSLELMVNVSQEDAVQLYQSFGFTITRTAEDQKMGDGELHDEYVMRLAVNTAQ